MAEIIKGDEGHFPHHKQLRKLLRKKGVDPDEAIIADKDYETVEEFTDMILRKHNIKKTTNFKGTVVWH